MKKIILLYSIILISQISKSQDSCIYYWKDINTKFILSKQYFTNNTIVRIDSTILEKKNGYVIFNNIKYYYKYDKAPEFPGGKTELEKFNRINQPHTGIKTDGNPIVFLCFTVSEEGKICNIGIFRRGKYSYLEKDAINYIKKLPLLIPAYYENRIVSSIIIFPVHFVLE
ncbi:MAG: hypothetical protein U0W24_15480 [Bacteroidales bacterium]